MCYFLALTYPFFSSFIKQGRKWWKRVGNEEENELWEGVAVNDMSLSVCQVSFSNTTLEKKKNNLIRKQPSRRSPNVSDLVEKLDSHIYMLR